VDEQPQVHERAEVAYASLPVTVTLEGLPGAVDAGFPELFGWLAEHGAEPAGAPLIRYLVMPARMGDEMEAELGIPVAGGVASSGRVRAGVLPAGRYATLLHTGPYGGLVGANAAVQRWAGGQGLVLESSADGLRWAGRVEHYLTDPAAEPDPARWQTEVAYLIRDGA
jgi:effector-binding domain-containing protein